MMYEYRGNPCPARPTGLPHTQQGLKCLHCGTPVSAYPQNDPAYPQKDASPAPPVDVTQRLRDLGLIGPEAESDLDREDIPVEPKAVTGQGPQGRPNGLGRGEFTARDMWRTVTYVRFREHLAARGGGEEGATLEP